MSTNLAIADAHSLAHDFEPPSGVYPRSPVAPGNDALEPTLEVVEEVVLSEDESDIRCAICRTPSYGAQCPCCRSELCTDHDYSRHRWCDRCERGYRAQHGLLERVLGAIAIASSLGAIAFVAQAHVKENPYLKGFSAAALLAWTMLTVAIVCVRGYGRTRFRAGIEAQLAARDG